MLIDWFTVGAQTLNFLVLVWLLKRLLYQPILVAIDAREKRIAAALADADEKKTAAIEERDAFHRKNEEFDRQRAALMAQAAGEAQAERQRLLDQARQDADALRSKRQDALRAEERNWNSDISHRICDEVFSIARKTLTDLAGTTLEERMGAVLAQRLRALAPEQKAGLAQALGSGASVGVRSAFALPVAQQSAIQAALEETFATQVQVQYDTRPELVSGIEVMAGGWKFSWNIADYLLSMRQNIAGLLREQAEPTVTVDTGDRPRRDPHGTVA